MRVERKHLFLAFCALVTLSSGPVNAHASEQGLVLLLPTDVYAVAGTLAVVASIVLVTCLPRQSLSRLFPVANLRAAPSSLARGAPSAVSFCASVFLLTLVYIGFLGPTDPQGNLLPLVVWTVWWGGVFVVQGVLFDLWKWINPWTGLVDVFGLGKSPLIKLPKAAKCWPAVVTLLCFQIFLLADVAPSDPSRLASFVLGYWIFTLIAIELCGKDQWLHQGECFSVMFRLIGTLRPVLLNAGSLHLGMPGWQALRLVPLERSQAVFCLAILTGGSFDGVNETFWWLAQLGINPLEFPGRSAVVWSSTLGLFGANAVLLLLFAGAIWIGVKMVQIRGVLAPVSFDHAFNMFAITLLPIALGYHFSHYLVSFMVQIKFTLSTASDPLALGWNLFGLGAVKATVGFLGVPETVKTIWLTQASVVVISHVVSVLLSHHVAEKLCCENRDVILIQVGLTILMIAYTVFGLWLLASPRGV